MEAAAEITSLFDSNGYLIEQATTNAALRDSGMGRVRCSGLTNTGGTPLVTLGPFKKFQLDLQGRWQKNVDSQKPFYIMPNLKR